MHKNLHFNAHLFNDNLVPLNNQNVPNVRLSKACPLVLLFLMQQQLNAGRCPCRCSCESQPEVGGCIVIAKVEFLSFLQKVGKYALNMQINTKYALYANKTLICTKSFICINAHP